jgi:predicted Zn-dependent protease
MKKFLFILCLSLGLISCPAFATEVDLTKDGQMQNYISNIGFKILNANRIEKRMTFYYKQDNKNLNACTNYANRTISFYRGMSTYLDDEDEYAAILSHEISHGVDSYDGILRGFFSGFSYELSSKKYEKKADKRAVDYMVKAGYNPVALIVVMSKTMPQTRYDWYLSHPLTSRRMMYVYEYIYNKYPAYLANNAYKNNVYYQNFLLTSRVNRENLQKKIENPDKKNLKVQYL